MKKDIGVGVVGLGMGKATLSVNAIPDLRLRVVAACDIDADRARRIAARHQVPFITTDYVDLMSLPGVDIAAIYSPDALHFDHAMAALLSGKHALCVQPFTLDLAQAVDLAREAEQRHLKLMVVQSARWRRDVQAVHALQMNGELGELRLLEATHMLDFRLMRDRSPWRNENPQSQNLIYSALCEPIDILRFLGGEIAEVSSIAQRSGLDARCSTPDNFLVTLQFENGAIGHIKGLYGCVTSPAPSLEFSLYGTRGSYRRDRVMLDRIAHRPPMSFDWEAVSSPSCSPLESVEYADEMITALRHFEAVLTAGATPIGDAWDAIKTLAVCAAVQESLDTGLSALVRPLASSSPLSDSLNEARGSDAFETRKVSW